ncbi:MAG TPA: glycosyltransferase family 4 protein [Pyrinomonadaceae bacterium]|nr:glycosyltransferase family 4 protein [Pyrinomonadaceae bacterium]
MKILYLNPSGQLGGAEVCLLNMMTSLLMSAPDLKLHLVASEEGALVAKTRALGVPVTVLPFPGVLAQLGDAGAGGPAGDQISRFALLRKLLSAAPHAASYRRKLRRVITDLSPDIIHTNGFKMHALAAMARPVGTPVIWHLHDYVRPRPVMARLLRWLAPRCAVAIANSNSVAEDFRAVCGERLPVQTIYNGVDLSNFSPDGERLDLDALSLLPPAPHGTVRVGLLATLARWKGHETFLKAISLLPSDLPVRGYIATGALYQTAGSQYSINELRQLASSLGVSHRVGFTGFVSDPAAAMRSLDVVVHCSTQPEPFGLVIAEALACGRAVVASHAAGATELIELGESALGHQPGDAETLAMNIARLVASKELRVRLGQAGRESALRCFDRRRLSTELISLYNGLTSPLASQAELVTV